MDGGDNIRPATWESVSMMLQLVRTSTRIQKNIHLHVYHLHSVFNLLAVSKMNDLCNSSRSLAFTVQCCRSKGYLNAKVH